MAYARHGSDSDVYFYRHPNGLTCICTLLRNFTTWEMLLHLGVHARHGDRVPPTAMERLIGDLKDGK